MHFSLLTLLIFPHSEIPVFFLPWRFTQSPHPALSITPTHYCSNKAIIKGVSGLGPLWGAGWGAPLVCAPTGFLYQLPNQPGACLTCPPPGSWSQRQSQVRNWTQRLGFCSPNPAPQRKQRTKPPVSGPSCWEASRVLLFGLRPVPGRRDAVGRCLHVGHGTAWSSPTAGRGQSPRTAGLVCCRGHLTGCSAWVAHTAVLYQATPERVPTHGTAPGSDDTCFPPSTSG